MEPMEKGNLSQIPAHDVQADLAQSIKCAGYVADIKHQLKALDTGRRRQIQQEEDAVFEAKRDRYKVRSVVTDIMQIAAVELQSQRMHPHHYDFWQYSDTDAAYHCSIPINLILFNSPTARPLFFPDLDYSDATPRQNALRDMLLEKGFAIAIDGTNIRLTHRVMAPSVAQ